MFEDLSNIKGGRRDFRKFAITVGVVLALFGVVFFWKEKNAFRYFWAISAFLLLTGIAVPIILKPLYYLWMGLATILGWIVSRIILSILFYIIFTPIGVIGRLFGKRFLDLNWPKSVSSYWNYRDGKPKSSDRYEKQF
jgi:hypothetical protein